MPENDNEKLLKVAEKLLGLWGVASGATTVSQIMRAIEYLDNMNFLDLNLTKSIQKIAEEAVSGIKKFESDILGVGLPTGILLPSLFNLMKPGCQDCSDDEVPPGDLSNPNSTRVFYRIDRATIPEKIGHVDTEDLIHHAWLSWGVHILNFQSLQVEDPAAANVIIVAEKIDGSGDVLGRAPKAGPGRLNSHLKIKLDRDDIGSWSPKTFLAVMTHEAGHILGIGHIGGSNLMNKVIPAGVFEPTEADLAQLHRFWPRRELSPALDII